MADSEELRTELAHVFGPEIVKNGTVDRRALGALVFKNKVGYLNSVIIIFLFYSGKTEATD